MRERKTHFLYRSLVLFMVALSLSLSLSLSPAIGLPLVTIWCPLLELPPRGEALRPVFGDTTLHGSSTMIHQTWYHSEGWPYRTLHHFDLNTNFAYLFFFWFHACWRAFELTTVNNEEDVNAAEIQLRSWAPAPSAAVLPKLVTEVSVVYGSEKGELATVDECFQLRG